MTHAPWTGSGPPDSAWWTWSFRRPSFDPTVRIARRITSRLGT